MRRNPIETVMGALLLLVAVIFVIFAYNTADLQPAGGYTVQARFTKIGGLKVGADVKISGVRIGSVISETLDPTTFHAIVTMTILPSIHLPVDTRAIISSDGLLGGAYIRLEPGNSTQMLQNGEALRKIQNYQSMEDMVGEMIFLTTRPTGEFPSDNAPPPSTVLP